MTLKSRCWPAGLLSLDSGLGVISNFIWAVPQFQFFGLSDQGPHFLAVNREPLSAFTGCLHSLLETHPLKSAVICPFLLWLPIPLMLPSATSQGKRSAFKGVVVLAVTNPPANAGDIKRHGFDPWARKISWRRKWQPTPVYLPAESLGQRSLAGYSPRGRIVGHDWSRFGMHIWLY